MKDPIETLKKRLASGEISIAEYREIESVLLFSETEDTQESPPATEESSIEPSELKMVNSTEQVKHDSPIRQPEQLSEANMETIVQVNTTTPTSENSLLTAGTSEKESDITIKDLIPFVYTLLIFSLGAYIMPWFGIGERSWLFASIYTFIFCLNTAAWHGYTMNIFIRKDIGRGDKLLALILLSVGVCIYTLGCGLVAQKVTNFYSWWNILGFLAMLGVLGKTLIMVENIIEEEKGTIEKKSSKALNSISSKVTHLGIYFIGIISYIWITIVLGASNWMMYSSFYRLYKF
ncbi:hypothetical protein [Maridesulfovibrio sp.]|uniref:hypothetical protein n=1 Tax=Maridesulfovibrio sp. TaxID=2795000 RepID=UPI0039EEB73D